MVEADTKLTNAQRTTLTPIVSIPPLKDPTQAFIFARVEEGEQRCFQVASFLSAHKGMAELLGSTRA